MNLEKCLYDANTHIIKIPKFCSSFHIYSLNILKNTLSTPLWNRANKKLTVLKWDILDTYNIIKTSFFKTKNPSIFCSC